MMATRISMILALTWCGADRTIGEPIPENARYACPMQSHPDEADPAQRGPYYAAEPGECPRCGMTLQPLDELDWVRVRRAAQGGDVAYTCPDHPHVFSKKPGECPRCGRKLMPFKVMYTCPDPAHAAVISPVAGNCPRCGRGLAVFRGVWLDETMAAQNVPPAPELAEVAAYRCRIHPLVHSDRPGSCTICGAPLESTSEAAAEIQAPQIPAGAAYTCPMKQCWQFSDQPGQCPVCGMQLKPINEVGWAKEMLAARPAPAAQTRPAPAAQMKYICPMHPQEVQSPEPGTCSICGMRLVDRAAFKLPQDAPARVAAQMNYITEHYLELQKLLASDRTTDIARQALGLVSASEELAKHLDDPAVDLPPEVKAATQKLHAAALKITGTSLAEDRVVFVDISAAMQTLVHHARPDRQRWPKLYIYHCPMSKGDWLQASEPKANPYYGFTMLNCGQLRGIE
jgi:hypothetical protein